VAAPLIVVTRPEPAATGTARALEAARINTLVVPLLEIQPATPMWSAPPQSLYAAIFVSTHAVQHGAFTLKPHATTIAHVYGVGRTTAAALIAAGFDARSPRAGEDTEALLAEPAFTQLRHRQIVIVKGESESGGRTLMADTLRARGAVVVEVNCYRRGPRALGAEEQLALQQAVRQGAWALAGSVETLDALVAHVGLADIAHVLVPHPRVAEAAAARGAKIVSVVSLEDNKLIDSVRRLSSHIA
jgi:uroporphyrinogen-III synthase